ncbi:tetratricopeptide repeat protein [Neobacillus jeddahensis]|uniref:tetratricopeptide repeat protein n=1 Tax=Neobacillus jeddahensis TaxID=1461580 RepID=UPI0006945D13|nr:SEC-C metal-binding domain-containing protein [Neobacillus jeddahensis]
MERINRNGPCPCGSGKKYKKCCGASEAVSINEIIESEMEELQKELLHFAYYHFGEAIRDDFEDLENTITIEIDEEREFYELIHAIWFSLFDGLENENTIMEAFITKEAGKIKRPRLRNIFQTWTKPRIIAGKVVSSKQNHLIVEDGFTLEQLDTIMIGVPDIIEEGSFVLGILLPYEQHYVFYPAPFNLPGLKPEHAWSYIEDSCYEAVYDSPQEFLNDHFIEVMSELPLVGGMVEVEAMEWPAPVYKQVADLFKEKMESQIPPPLVDTGLILWFHFCQKKQKRIQSPNLYVAALQYLISLIAPPEEMMTQKELAKQYGVSAGSISSIVSELESELAAEIAELLSLDDEEELENLSEYTNPSIIEFPGGLKVKSDDLSGQMVQTLPSIDKPTKKTGRTVSRRDEERARDLIYNAFQSEGKQRYKFAEEALKQNPNCVDAYVILAEKTKSLEESILLYEKGIQAGEQDLGKAFFSENRGSFWGLIETRPFMRAKLHYAEALSLLGKINKAIQQYEELLELNPNDNQGVRYSLFVAYVDSGHFEKAAKLLHQYEEPSAQGVYNKVLLELFTNGFTKNAEMLLKNAKQVNRHVISYLTGKKRLPAYPPDFYGFGDENEAIVYADMHLHLWRKIDGLGEWLKGIK